MRITPEEVTLYFRLMSEVQHFLNRRLKIVPGVRFWQDVQDLPWDRRVALRDAVWEHPECIADFLEKNPAKLPAEELELVRSWQRFVKGQFFVERNLKMGTIFMQEANGTKVFVVHGLRDEMVDLLSPTKLPVYVETVLLPFRGRIIYDGIIRPYSITFGSNMRQSMREIYMRAKNRGELIVSLGEEGESTLPAPPPPKTRDWRPALQEIAESAGKLKAQPNDPLQSAAFALLKASANLARATVAEESDEDESIGLEKAIRAAERAARRLLQEAKAARWEGYL